MFARKVFVSSLIAIISVCGTARAAVDPAATGIAATSYVDKQMAALHPVAKSGDYADLDNKPQVMDNESANAEYLEGGHFFYDDKIPTVAAAKLIGQKAVEDTNIKNSVVANKSYDDIKKIATQEIRDSAPLSTMATVTAIDKAIDDLHPVAKSGDYNDLDNKPDVPAVIGMAEVSQQISDAAGNPSGAATDDGVATPGAAFVIAMSASQKLYNDTVAPLEGKIDGKTDYSNQRFARQTSDEDIDRVSPGGYDEATYPSVALSKKIAERISNQTMDVVLQIFDDSLPTKQDWGTIPVGSAGSTTTASIWVE